MTTLRVSAPISDSPGRNLGGLDLALAPEQMFTSKQQRVCPDFDRSRK